MKNVAISIMLICTMACSYGQPGDRKEISKDILARVQGGEAIDREEAIALLEEAGGRYSEQKMYGATRIKIDLPSKRVVGDEIPAIASRIPEVQWLALGTSSQTTDTGLGFIKNMSQLEILTVTGEEITDAGVAQLCGMAKLQSLQLNNTAITDSGLKLVSGMKNIKGLTIIGAEKITDKGLAHLSRMANLGQLTLVFAPLTDAGLRNLQPLDNLQFLCLSHSPITDEGLVHLEKMESLKFAFLVGTQVTPEAAKRLKEKRPDLFLPEILTEPCKGSRKILQNVKTQWARKELKEEGAQPAQGDLEPLFDIKYTGGLSALKCEEGGKISINPIGEPPSCSIHGTK